MAELEDSAAPREGPTLQDIAHAQVDELFTGDELRRLLGIAIYGLEGVTEAFTPYI